MNKLCTLGRVSTDIEIKDVNGRNCATFNVASKNKNKDKNTNEYGTNFYRCTAWGAAADTASRFLKKGHRVGITGDLVIRDYVGNDNLKHTVVELNNCEVDLVETKAESEAKAQGSAGSAAVTPAHAPAPQATTTQGFTPVETDELPF